MRRGGSRLGNAADLLYRLARAPPRSEGSFLRGGRGPGGRFVGHRVRRVLGLRPPRNPGPRSRGVRVPRGSWVERVRGSSEFGLVPPEDPELLRHGRLREPGELELGRLDTDDRFLRTVRGLRGTIARWVPCGSEPPIPREPPGQDLGRATGRPRDPAPPVHLWAALNRGPSPFFILENKYKWTIT